MIRRPRRSVPATIVGLVLLAAAVLAAISCIQLIAGNPPLVSFTALGRLAATTTWDDVLALAAGAVLALVGLVLLGCALLPGTPTVLALASGTDASAAGVARRSLVHDLAVHARRTDGVTGARVTVGARTVKVQARTPLRDHAGLADRVGALVTERLDDLDLARPLRLRVGVRLDRSAR